MSKPKEYVEVPDQCPRLEKCTDLVSKDEFDGVCDSPSWVHCPTAEASGEASKFKKPPGVWLNE